MKQKGFMFNNKCVTLITRTMNRLSDLEQTLPMYCKIQEVDKIIIVDWGMRENLMPLVTKMKDDRIVIIQVPDQQYFLMGNSRNIGVRYADDGYILMIDCDIKLYKSLFCFVNGSNQFYTKIVDKSMGLGGTCIFERSMWEKVNGYVEDLPGWGWDDDDFYRRLQRKGIRRILCFTPEFITHIDHGDQIRIMNMESNLKPIESSRNNEKILSTINAQTQQHKKYLCNIINKNYILLDQLV
jgi:predicted glycosyltransferase involved in capsule biosynthesis